MITVLTFYQYKKTENPEKLQKSYLNFCRKTGLKGKIMVAEEGINGTVSGETKSVKKYENKIKKTFPEIHFKKTYSKKHPYKRITVKLRREIITSNMKVDLKNRGKHIEPGQLKEWFDKKEDFVTVDARNDYEHKIGKFENSVTLKLKMFRDFYKTLNQLNKYKDKKIVMYCTGGVRCEKSSAFLKENGFKSVHQLKGGIINYLNQFPRTYFKGKCFVFDDRISIDSGTKEIGKCEICSKTTSSLINCENKKCNKYFVCCTECTIKFENTCSNLCRYRLKLENLNTRIINIKTRSLRAT